MARQKPIEMISPPNMLKAKIGGSMPALDQRAIARAEAELEKLSDQFTDWIAEEVENLADAWNKYDAEQGSLDATRELHRRGHDLKGLAPTYGYPLVGRVCSTLCKLTSDEYPNLRAPAALLHAHVAAVKAMVSGNIKSADHPVGVQLVAELELQTQRVIEHL